MAAGAGAAGKLDAEPGPTEWRNIASRSNPARSKGSHVVKLGLFLIAVIVCLSASAAKSVLPPPPPGAVTPEEAQQRLQERQRRRQDTPQPEPKPAPAKAAAPDPTVKALCAKQGRPRSGTRVVRARLPAIQAAYVDSLAADARRLEAESLQVERQPVPRVRVGGGAFGTTEYGPDEAAGRASRDA